MILREELRFNFGENLLPFFALFIPLHFQIALLLLESRFLFSGSLVFLGGFRLPFLQFRLEPFSLLHQHQDFVFCVRILLVQEFNLAFKGTISLV